MQFKPWILPIVVANIVIVDTLTHCALLYFLCDLKVALMNVQCSLILEIYALQVQTEAAKLYFTLPKYSKTFDLLLFKEIDLF